MKKIHISLRKPQAGELKANRKVIAVCVVLAAMLFICFLDDFTPSGRVIPNYFKYVIVVSLIYSVASLGINFYSGYQGDTSLGHAVFFGTGAYVTAYLTTQFSGINFWASILIGMAFSAVLSLPVAWAGSRVKGSFMVVITYGYCEIFRYLAINSNTLGGTAGMAGIPSPKIFGVRITKIPWLPSNKDGFILILMAIVGFLALFTYRIVNSRVGYALAAVREDEIAAYAMGVNVKAYKRLAIITSAVITSVAGSFYAGFTNVADPSLFGATLSITIFTMLVIGGRRSISGAILGAFIVVICPELLRYVQDLIGLPFDPWYILYGLMLVIIMRFKPEGLLGTKES
jgi:branched-chain amino acid transport system permease protein